MLPYLEQPVWHLGPMTIHAFGVAVAAAFCLGLTFAQRRFEQASLDPVIGQQLGGWVIVGGVLGAHLFSALLYFPEKWQADPWYLLRVWQDISSFGGALGGIAGVLLFFVLRRPETTWSTKLAFLDGVAFIFPSALAVGRIGCALAHDHPGAVTSFPLAISLETPAAQAYIRDVYETAGLAIPPDLARMGFHDLGLYELLVLAVIVVPLFAYWSRSERPTGFYLVAFAALYLPLRFGLDMLRVADVRYLGLTPAQWTAASILTLLPFVVMGHRKHGYAIAGVVILSTALACWSGTP